MVKGYLISDPIVSSSIELFWDPESENEAFSVIGPAMKAELNKAPSFEFTVIPSNIQYNNFNRKKTVIQIYDGDDLLFDGRVSSLATDFYKQKKVTCEGAIAYLMDSLQPGDKIQDGTITEVENNNYHSETTEVSTKESIEAHINRMLTRHNSDVEEFKRIYLGIIDSKSGEKEFDSSGYRTTWEALESDLIERFGGYMQVRRGYRDGEDSEKNYLDYLPIKDLTGSTSNTMTFGENIIELTQEQNEDDEIFTILLPFGKEYEKNVTVDGKQKKVRDRITISEATNAVTTEPTDGKEISPYQDPNDSRCIIVSPVALAKYGAIYRCMDFSDRETANELYTRAVEYIEDTCGFRNTYEVKAIDIHTTNPSSKERTKIGDRVKVKSNWHNINDHSLYVKAAQYDLENPENDTFTIGFPYQEREDKKISSSSTGSARGNNNDGSYGGGYGYSASNLDNYIKYNDGRLEIHTAWIAEVVDINTGTSTRLEQDERHISMTADAIIGHVDGEPLEEQFNRLSNLEVSDTGVRCIVQIQDDHGRLLVNHQSRIEMNEDAIQMFTGSMYVEEEDVTFTEVPATSITETTNPNKRRWYERKDTSSALDLKDPTKFQITPDTTVTEGKSYYTKRVSKSNIVVAEGAGMYNEKDRTRYGLWDEGNLTAGVLCERINDPEYIEVSVGEKEAAHARGDNPSTNEPWWYSKNARGDFERTTDTVVTVSNRYWFKIAAQTQTQIRGDHIIVGVTSKYEGMDADNKAKLDKYLADHNLDATITEIASDVVVVNTLLAKYIEADEITANTSIWADSGYFNTAVTEVLYVAPADWGESHPDCTTLTYDDITTVNIICEGISISGVDFSSDPSGDISSDASDPADIIVGFGTVTTSGDTVTIPYLTAGDSGSYDDDHVITFDKPASLGAVTWSSGNTLTVKTAGGKDFIIGSFSNYVPSGSSEAAAMVHAKYLDTETTGYNTVYGFYYDVKDAITGNTATRKVMTFKTPKNRYTDATGTVRTRSATGKGDNEEISLGVGGVSTIYAQYKTEKNLDDDKDEYVSLKGIKSYAPEIRIYAKLGSTEYTTNNTVPLSYGGSVNVEAQKKLHGDDDYSYYRKLTVTAPAKPTISSPASASAPSGVTPTSLGSYGTTYEVHLLSGSTNLGNNIYFKTPSKPSANGATEAKKNNVTYNDGNTISLGYSDSVKVYGKYKLSDTSTYSTCSGITITSPSDNSTSITKSDIVVGSIDKYTRSGSQPGHGADFTFNSSSPISIAAEVQYYIYFKVSVLGVDKWYRICVNGTN